MTGIKTLAEMQEITWDELVKLEHEVRAGIIAIRLSDPGLFLLGEDGVLTNSMQVSLQAAFGRAFTKKEATNVNEWLRHYGFRELVGRRSRIILSDAEKEMLKTGKPAKAEPTIMALVVDERSAEDMLQKLVGREEANFVELSALEIVGRAVAAGLTSFEALKMDELMDEILSYGGLTSDGQRWRVLAAVRQLFFEL